MKTEYTGKKISISKNTYNFELNIKYFTLHNG